MAGIPGRSGPPGNQNAFRHGLTGLAQRRADGVLNPAEQSIRDEILSGLLADNATGEREFAFRQIPSIGTSGAVLSDDEFCRVHRL
jgi:hypothetical protein